MHTLLKASGAMLVFSVIAILLVSTPSPCPPLPTKSTPIDYSGRNVYRLDWQTIHPGNMFYSSIVEGPGFVTVRSFDDVLRWVESMPSGTILFCSRYQGHYAGYGRVFARGQFEYFLRACRCRGIRVVVDEWLPQPAR
jgi:hypothetical protein